MKRIGHTALLTSTLSAICALQLGCTSTRELAGAVTGKPYVPTAEDRAKVTASSDFKIVPPAQGKAALYIYRNSQLLGALRDREVFLNDKSYGRVGSGQYRRLELEPGEYKVRVQFATFAAQNPPTEGVMQLQPNSILIVRMNVGATQVATVQKYVGNVKQNETGLWANSFQLEVVPESAGTFDMSRIKEVTE